MTEAKSNNTQDRKFTFHAHMFVISIYIPLIVNLTIVKAIAFEEISFKRGNCQIFWERFGESYFWGKFLWSLIFGGI